MPPPEQYVFDELDFDYLQTLVGDARSAVVEIGANNGSDTLRLLEAFPNARVYAFEPDPRAIAKFKSKITDKRARLLECAVGEQDGSAPFHVCSGPAASQQPAGPADAIPDSWDQSGSLRAPKSHLEVWPWVKFEQQITVPVISLDSFFLQEGLETIDLLWADTQGAEGDLIAGGQVALSRTRYIYTEYSNEEWYEGQINLDQLLAMLPDFKLVERYSTDILLENQAMKASRGTLAGLKKNLRRLFFS